MSVVLDAMPVFAGLTTSPFDSAALGTTTLDVPATCPLNPGRASLSAGELGLRG